MEMLCNEEIIIYRSLSVSFVKDIFIDKKSYTSHRHSKQHDQIENMVVLLKQASPRNNAIMDLSHSSWKTGVN